MKDKEILELIRVVIIIATIGVVVYGTYDLVSKESFCEDRGYMFNAYTEEINSKVYIKCCNNIVNYENTGFDTECKVFEYKARGKLKC